MTGRLPEAEIALRRALDARARPAEPAARPGALVRQAACAGPTPPTRSSRRSRSRPTTCSAPACSTLCTLESRALARRRRAARAMIDACGQPPSNRARPVTPSISWHSATTRRAATPRGRDLGARPHEHDRSSVAPRRRRQPAAARFRVVRLRQPSGGPADRRPARATRPRPLRALRVPDAPGAARRPVFAPRRRPPCGSTRSTGLSPDDAAARVRDDRIDVLFDLNGFTGDADDGGVRAAPGADPGELSRLYRDDGFGRLRLDRRRPLLHARAARA